MASRLPVVERLRQLAQKWQTNAEVAQPTYIQVATRPDVGQIWQQNAAAAAGTYNAAMEEVIRENRWGNRMATIDPRIYTEGIRAKGDRRVSGIRIAAGKWEANFRPIAEAIDRVRPTLPPRGPKMSDANINRWLTIIRAIHEAALARRGIAAPPAPAPAVPGYASPTPAYASGQGSSSLPGVQAPTPPPPTSTPPPTRPQVGTYLGGYQAY